MTELSKRVVFTMGGKGGVGKTGVVVALAEWFRANEIPITLLDLDTENKARGSLKHFFDGTVTKVDVHTPAGLDAFVDHLDGSVSIILADMGAGAGQVAADWFDSMHEDVATTGVRFTAVGIVTPDPASVESVLAWASRLQDRVGVRHRRERYECAGGLHVLAFNETGRPIPSSLRASHFADGISPG
jgi:CobQ/CobB/MinD/ParA nucleotide binding domain